MTLIYDNNNLDILFMNNRPNCRIERLAFFDNSAIVFIL